VIAMPATSLRRCFLKPVLSDEQWLRIARCLAVSERELQIVKRVFEDEPEKRIAGALKISPHTVHTHLMHLHWKLGVKSRVGLVLRVFREYVAEAERQEPALPGPTPLPCRRKAA
jgi:DNA-binding CsgD family transcriptional regulator